MFKLILHATVSADHFCSHFIGRGFKTLANEDTLLPTQMFPRLPARATFVADTNFVSGTWDTKNVSDFVQKHFASATNVSQMFAQHGNTTFILCPARLRAQETS